jgi:ABC-2 type transport system ATP-binding protein
MMIRARGLKKFFGTFEALKGIDLNVEKGEIYGFLGHNGAGKSTTMNILAGLSKADYGKCAINGWDLGKITHPKDLHIGYLPEEPKFYPWMTGREVIEYLGSRLDKTNVGKRVDEIIEWVGLSKAAKRRVGGYSRGMKQRLGMAAALIYDHDLLLLDEPSSALDPEGRSDVLNLIMDLKTRGKTIFLSTHILSDVERVCDRVGILSNGEMVLEKPLKTLLSENIRSVYDISLYRPAASRMIKDIQDLPGIGLVEDNGTELSIETAFPEEMSKELLRFFAGANTAIKSFSLKKASLEDIFLEESRGRKT